MTASGFSDGAYEYYYYFIVTHNGTIRTKER